MPACESSRPDPAGTGRVQSRLFTAASTYAESMTVVTGGSMPTACGQQTSPGSASPVIVRLAAAG